MKIFGCLATFAGDNAFVRLYTNQCLGKGGRGNLIPVNDDDDDPWSVGIGSWTIAALDMTMLTIQIMFVQLFQLLW